MPDATRAAGEDWAWFYVQNRRALTAYAVSLCGDAADAADLIQDVLLRLIRDGAAPGDARAFVFRCLRNLAIDRRRGQRVPVGPAVLLDGVTAAFLNGAVGDADTRERVGRVRAALESLSSPQREVIVLKVWGELTFHEIAGVLEQPLGTVTSHYNRGLGVLRGRLAAEVRDAVR